MVGFRCSVFSQASRGRESAGVVARAFQPEHCLAGRAPVVHKTVARAFQPEHCLEKARRFFARLLSSRGIPGLMSGAV